MSQLIASISEKNLKIYDFINEDDCRLVSKRDFTSTPTCLSWNHTNQVVSIGFKDNKADLIQANSGQLLSALPFSLHEGINSSVNSIKFSGNSRYLSTAEGNTILLWDLKKRCLKTKLKGNANDYLAVSFFADGTICAGDSSGCIKIWDIKANDHLYKEIAPPIDDLQLNNIGLCCMELSYCGPSRIAAGYTDGSLCLYDPVLLTHLRKLNNVHHQDISALVFSPKNPRLVATASHDGYMKLVDTGNRSDVPSASIHVGVKITSLSFHENAIHSAVGTDDGRILFYDWRNTRKPVLTIEAQSTFPIYGLSFQMPKIQSDNAIVTDISPKNGKTTTIPLSTNKINDSNNDNLISPIKKEIKNLEVVDSKSSNIHEKVEEKMKNNEINNSFTSINNGTNHKNEIYGTKLDKNISFVTDINVEITSSSADIEINGNNTNETNKENDRNNSSSDNPNNEKNENHESKYFPSNLQRPVTTSELQEAINMMKYDFHKELQMLIREQVRQFSIAKDDTAKMINELGNQLKEVLKSNKELRIENEKLRRIY